MQDYTMGCYQKLPSATRSALDTTDAADLIDFMVFGHHKSKHVGLSMGKRPKGVFTCIYATVSHYLPVDPSVILVLRNFGWTWLSGLMCCVSCAFYDVHSEPSRSGVSVDTPLQLFFFFYLERSGWALTTSCSVPKSEKLPRPCLELRSPWRLSQLFSDFISASGVMTLLASAHWLNRPY